MRFGKKNTPMNALQLFFVWLWDFFLLILTKKGLVERAILSYDFSKARKILVISNFSFSLFDGKYELKIQKPKCLHEYNYFSKTKLVPDRKL